MENMKKDYQLPIVTIYEVEFEPICQGFQTNNYADANERNNLDEDGKEQINWDQEW